MTALEQNLLALWSRFGGDGCTLHELDDAIWFDTPARTLPYNPDRVVPGVAAGKDGAHDSATPGRVVSTLRIATVADILRASAMHVNTRERTTNA